MEKRAGHGVDGPDARDAAVALDVAAAAASTQGAAATAAGGSDHAAAGTAAAAGGVSAKAATGDVPLEPVVEAALKKIARRIVPLTMAVALMNHLDRSK